jgi:hypothetical protein
MPLTIDWEMLHGVWAYFVGIVAGGASMYVYARLSPQAKLKSLKVECSAMQEQLAAYEGDFSGAMALTAQNLRLTFRRLSYALWPSLIAGLPVIGALFAINDHYYCYFLATIVTAIAIKYQFQIA